MHLHAPDFHAKNTYVLNALNNHVCFQLSGDGRKYYILRMIRDIHMSYGMGLLCDFTGHWHTIMQSNLYLFKYEKIQYYVLS